MASFRITLFSALLLGSGGVAGGAEPPRPDAAADVRNTVQVGPVTGDPEKDSVGLVRDARGECGLGPLFSQDVVAHGPRTGDPEKDSLGFRVTGQSGCADATR
jgi:hypothetical protein